MLALLARADILILTHPCSPFGKSGKYYTTDVGSNRESCRNKFSLGLV
jgi:hypothetical protein